MQQALTTARCVRLGRSPEFLITSQCIFIITLEGWGGGGGPILILLPINSAFGHVCMVSLRDSEFVIHDTIRIQDLFCKARIKPFWSQDS
jgi:hypothetical protein